jgi:hypothetical protein
VAPDMSSVTIPEKSILEFKAIFQEERHGQISRCHEK